MKTMRADSYREMTWKNGGGTTKEIVRSPDDDSFDWRVSVATVTKSGPFSIFPGCDRVLILLEGSGMTLNHSELARSTDLEPLVPYRFNGEWRTECTLSETATRDFNVISRRDRVEAEVSVMELDARSREIRASLLYCASGSVMVREESEETSLSASDSVLVSGVVHAHALSGAATVIVVQIGPPYSSISES